jgi:hypothetical protein
MSWAAANSSATFEHVVGADGQPLVRKRFSPAGDWLTRATDGIGRARLLWECGMLGRAAAAVDHTVVDVVREEGDDVVVMRDVSADLFPPDGRLPRDATRRLLAGLAALHALPVDRSWPSLCAIGDRYGMFAPARVGADEGPHPHPRRSLIMPGWESFKHTAPSPVVDAILAVHEDPSVLSDRLGRFPNSVLHGDAKPANLGLGRHGAVAIDWGELTGCGPREIDVSWFVLMASYRTEASPEELFADYEEVSGAPLDGDALDLAALGSLAQMGWRIDLPEYGDVTRWWIQRVERTDLV